MAGKPTLTTADASRAGRALRADARRNRARVLEVAAEAFATDGLAVAVHEITQQALFAAILLGRMEQLTGQADALAQGEDPGAAFFVFFATLVHAGAANRGLADR